MRIALVQIQSKPGNVQANLTAHLNWVHKAIQQNCDAVFFPELSLTGYEPSLSSVLRIDPTDDILQPFQAVSNEAKITIGIGVPTKSNGETKISMVVFQPHTSCVMYSKQILHADEKPYFVEGDKQLIIELQGVKIAPAICFESLSSKHFESALSAGFDIYLATVAKPQKALSNALPYYVRLATDYNKNILFVNAIGMADNFIAYGKSSLINQSGEITKQLSATTETLLIYNH